MGMGIKKWGSSDKETVYLGRSQSVKGDAKTKWAMFWRKISREKKKIFNAPVTLQTSYDPEEYSQNFDHGTGWAEPDNLSRSFSARYADPLRILPKNNVRYSNAKGA